MTHAPRSQDAKYKFIWALLVEMVDNAKEFCAVLLLSGGACCTVVTLLSHSGCADIR